MRCWWIRLEDEEWVAVGALFSSILDRRLSLFIVVLVSVRSFRDACGCGRSMVDFGCVADVRHSIHRIVCTVEVHDICDVEIYMRVRDDSERFRVPVSRAVVSTKEKCISSPISHKPNEM